MDDHIVVGGCPDHLAVVDGAVLELVIGGFDAYLGLKPAFLRTRWMPRTPWPIASP